ncbi:MAG: hypothetical protein RIE24_19500 [Silicimonas sp.]
MVGPEGNQVPITNKYLGCPTRKYLPFEGISEISQLSNRFSSLIAPVHMVICRTVVYCLKNPDETSIWQLSAILNARLQTRERVFLAVSALMALDDDEYRAVVDFMEGER